MARHQLGLSQPVPCVVSRRLRDREGGTAAAAVTGSGEEEGAGRRQIVASKAAKVTLWNEYLLRSIIAQDGILFD